MTDQACAGSGAVPRELLLKWAAQLARLVCFLDLTQRDRLDADVAEPVRRIALQMRDAALTPPPFPAVPHRKAGDVHDECLDASETDRRRQQDESSAQAVTGGSHPVEQHASPAEGVAPPLERVEGRSRTIDEPKVDDLTACRERVQMLRQERDQWKENSDWNFRQLKRTRKAEAQLAADLARVTVDRDAYRAAALRCETENGTHCPEDRSCGETIEALKAQLAALRPYVQHTPECEVKSGHTIVYPEPVHMPSITEALAMEQGRLAKGRPDANLQRTSSRASKCSCGLAAILDPPAKETV